MPHKDACTVITGGGSGIGLALAARALARGANVITIGRRTQAELPELEALQRRHPDHLEHHVADLESPEGTEHVADALRRPIGALVHCAGRLPNAEAMATPRGRRTELCELVSLHAGAVLHLIDLVTAQLVDDSRVVLIGSNITGRVAPGLGPYAAAKGAVEVLTRYLAVTLAPRTAVMCVAPGLVDTAMSTAALADARVVAAILANTPLRRLASPVDIAAMIDALLTMRPCWATGQVLVVDGGNALTWPETP